LSVQSTFSLQKATLINSQLSTFPVLFFFIYITYRSSFLPKMYNVTFWKPPQKSTQTVIWFMHTHAHHHAPPTHPHTLTYNTHTLWLAYL